MGSTATTPLTRYHLLGRTGLRVSPLGLGAMTFGIDGSEATGIWGSWGSGEETSRAVFHRYLEAGGNFVDTAVNYGGSRSEELLGKFIAEAGVRDRLVLATKFTMATELGNPNAAGNGRKNLVASLDASLRRLRTDYVDLYWMHAWDTMTPVEEVMSTFDALVRSGKVRAVGFSNVPAWYVSKAQLTARTYGWEPIAALQLEYSLVERNLEREHVPAALDLGMAIVTYSPLASGFLTGKYNRATDGASGAGRLQELKTVAPELTGHSDQDWKTLEGLLTVASDVGRTPAQVAVNWVAQRPGVASTLLGARTVEQLEDNLAALDFTLSEEQRARLDEINEPERHQLYRFFSAGMAHRAPCRPTTAQLIRRAKEFVEAELSSSIRLTDIARAVGASPTYLTDAFRRVEGISLHKYLTQLRLARALVELPHASDLTTLALDLGFSSHSHFAAAFRRRFGCTPSEFRESTRTAARRPLL